MNARAIVIASTAVSLLALPAAAHHSFAMFDQQKVVTLTGTVKEFEYVNPHAWLYVAVTYDNGEKTLWGFEAEGPSALMRAGIKSTALQPGEFVTVIARPLRDGPPPAPGSASPRRTGRCWRRAR